MPVNLGFKFKQFFVFFGEELFLGLYLYALLMIQFVPRLGKKEKLLLGCSSIKYRKTKSKSSHNGQSEEREITRRTNLGIKGKSSKLKNAENAGETRAIKAQLLFICHLICREGVQGFYHLSILTLIIF